MSWWRRITGGSSRSETKSQRPDYVSEALALERAGDYDGAVTSYRLALRMRPNDTRILINMAIAFSKLGQEDEAVRAYKRALGVDPTLAAAHYGLAFLLLRRGDLTDAAFHLESFLMKPPLGSDTERWIAHARETLDRLRSDTAESPGESINPGPDVS
jgi:Flp pilus assembly protein TadD